MMKSIALENNLSETAFAVKEGERYHLRWFTPGGEIDLCGHATLVCAYVILNFFETSTAVQSVPAFVVAYLAFLLLAAHSLRVYPLFRAQY